LYVLGSAGIGITAPSVKLHVAGGSDAGLGGGGFIVTGTITSANIAIDNNEIMARSNGTASDLFLNHNGGNLIINGTNSTGNVGIGTSTPTSRLHVVGNIFATGNLDVSGTVGFGSVETLSDGGSNTIQSNSNIIPNLDGTWDLGSSTRDWSAVHSDSYLTPSPFGSDAKAHNLKAGIQEIMKLRPISYTNGDVQRFGLVGKEVQQVLPEVIRDWELAKDETGATVKRSVANVSLEYDAFIPVLINALQQQQQTITALEERLAKMEATLKSVTNDQMQSVGNISAGVVLEQNQPNPFSQSTIIRYRLPQGTSGVINIYDAGGLLVKSFKTNDSGQAIVNAHELKAGTYSYTLSLNGKMAATKKLVLVK
jgi:polyhydroxyalkanoate synthesis regulator phasin